MYRQAELHAACPTAHYCHLACHVMAISLKLNTYKMSLAALKPCPLPVSRGLGKLCTLVWN